MHDWQRPIVERRGGRIRGAIALVLVLVLGVVMGLNLPEFMQRFGINLVPNSFAKLSSIYNIIDKNHVNAEALSEEQAIDDAIRGMLSQVDGGYTRYETPAEVREFNESTIQGKYSGVGIQSLAPTGSEMEVEIVFRGSPAEAAGVKVRDRIIAVDNVYIKGLSQLEINNSIRGEAGTEVILTVLREGEAAPLKIPITRGVIALPVVDHWVEGEVGIMAMYRFTETAPQQLKEAILDLKEKAVGAILFDLRSNGGGLLYSAQEIVDFFLPKDKVIVRQVDRSGKEEVLMTKETDVIWEGPLAILLNHASASASEVVAGSLQDHNRAILLGEVSFGKGTVQVPYSLSDGSRLWVTQFRYLTPDGRDINGEGLTPSLTVSPADDSSTDRQLLEAIELVKEHLLNP